MDTKSQTLITISPGQYLQKGLTCLCHIPLFTQKRHNCLKAPHSQRQDPRKNSWPHREDRQEAPFLTVTSIHSKTEILPTYGQILQVKKANKYPDKVTTALPLQTSPTRNLTSKQTHSHLPASVRSLYYGVPAQ